MWKNLKVSKWSNLKLFTCLPRLLRRGDEQEELAFSFMKIKKAGTFHEDTIVMLLYDRILI